GGAHRQPSRGDVPHRGGHGHRPQEALGAMTALDDPVVSFTPAGHIIRSEMAVAGASMRSAKLAEVLGDIVKPGHFRTPANAIIYAAALALAEQGSPVDPNAVLARVTRDGDL